MTFESFSNSLSPFPACFAVLSDGKTEKSMHHYQVYTFLTQPTFTSAAYIDTSLTYHDQQYIPRTDGAGHSMNHL